MEQVDREEDPKLSWDLMVTRTRPRLYRAAFFRTGSAAEAEDVVQEVYLRAWEDREALAGRPEPTTRLFGILVNVVWNWRRKRLRWGRVRQRLRAPAAVPEGLERDERDRLWEAVQRLPEDDQEVLYLLHVEELSYGEIAAALGTSEGTVRTRVCRARQKLRMEHSRKESGS